ncbi:MAG: insulinase family protein, partial [Desulfobacterales bacterium]|nr:insulinase family protein [Desulfobacterales bacterium]
YHHEPESGSTTLTIERIDSVPFEGETESALKQRVLDDVADAVFQYRLDTLVRGESAGFTSASAYSGQFLRQLSVAAVTADCPPAKWRVGLTQLQKTLDQMLIFGAETRELNRVKADFLNELESAVKKADTRKSSNLARALLYSLNQKTVFQSPSQRYALLRPYIQDLTLDEVNAAFRRNWESDHRLVMVTGNLDLSGDAMSPVELIQDAHEAALAQEIAPYAQLEEKAFPYLQLPPVRFKVKKMEADVAGLGVTTLDFENNIRVNLKQTQFKKDEFLFKVVFGKGQASEPSDMPGLYLLAQSVIGNSGLGEMTPDQLDDALAGRDVGIGFGVGENYFSLSGAASPEEAELVYQLIYAHLMDPGFRENGLRLAQKRYRQQYESMVRTPDGVMAIQGKQFLSRGDLRFGYPDPARLDGIGLGDIKDWLVPQFKKAPLEISIVGDFDMEKMISITKAHVGAMEKRERAIPRTAYSPKKVGFPKGDRREFSLDSRIQKGMVQMVFKTDDFWDIKRTRRLSVLSQLVSERLRKVIREKLGATYSPYVYNDPALIYKGYGTFHMVVNIKPGNQDLVLESMEEILGNLRDGGISPSEVDLILKPIMTHLKELRQQNSYWLNSVMVNSRRHPQRFEWANGIMADYAGIEAKDLDRLVKTYLKPGADAVVLIQPRVTTP